MKNMRSMSIVTYVHEEDLEVTADTYFYYAEFHEGAHICGAYRKNALRNL